MSQQQRQNCSRKYFHLIPPFARPDTTSRTCTFLYELLPSILYQYPHSFHRLLHLPEISSLQIPRHRRSIQPQLSRRRLQSALLPERCNRLPLFLGNLLQQSILQSINQIRRGIEHRIPRCEPRQDFEFISRAAFHSSKRGACQFKRLSSQPIHRPLQLSGHPSDSDPHPQPQRPHRRPQIENQFRQSLARPRNRLKFIPCRNRIR